MNKNLMSVGEISKAIGITRKMILNYEAKGLLFPDEKEGDNGNRYYTADSLTRARTIRVLQNLGLSLDEIKGYYDDTTDLEQIIKRLEKMRDELDLNIEKLKERIKTDNDFEVKHVTLPQQTVFCKDICTASIQERKDILRNVVVQAMKMYGSDTSKRLYYIEYDVNNPAAFRGCVSVPPESTGENVELQQPIKVISVYYHGDYDGLPSVRDRLIEYAEKNNLKTRGLCRHIYLEGPPQHTKPEKFITQVALLLEE